ncbi:hypothetical protein Q2T94_01230 [Paeniglutamicibacter sulfureus]|uniref:hypothetical protein n=1 Tax=Paeniglutamicibacter sulfureus TaxID=43666 RepID=UPI00266671F3|nr:hypothetical protein [Paeniglutamicibacter sulfureus]MDO2932929.1 hypothetical protein [Paeniglutamicibacter sulfureus]
MSQPARLRRPAHTAGRRRAPAVPARSRPRHAMSAAFAEDLGMIRAGIGSAA